MSRYSAASDRPVAVCQRTDEECRQKWRVWLPGTCRIAEEGVRTKKNALEVENDYVDTIYLQFWISLRPMSYNFEVNY